MLLVVFALPEEARVFRRRLVRKTRQGQFISGAIDGQQVGICFVGVRATAIADLEAAIRQLRPSLVINSGFAGATRALLEPGDFLLAANYTTAKLAPPSEKLVDAIGKFVSVDEILGPAEKAKQGDLAVAIDMESAAIAATCEGRHVPLLTARMISDSCAESIPAVFIRRKLPNFRELLPAAKFAVRMLHLTRLLGDRLTRLIRWIHDSELQSTDYVN
jgi:nucleoside phosphorylase